MKLANAIKALEGVADRLERLAGLLPVATTLSASEIGFRRVPGFWSDRPVREAVIAAHREMSINELIARLTAQFGADRAPSRSAIHRAWQQLDKFKAAERRS